MARVLHDQRTSYLGACKCGKRHRDPDMDCPVVEWKGRKIVCCQEKRIGSGLNCAAHQTQVVASIGSMQAAWSERVGAEGVH